ncbi:PIN-like domain-containing protein [Streptomonospora litoralis]|uniref:VapC45 PIN like domain-containing protein n=1 Tax=Streptomonospora litoralis TaxID=2498135 RepID=A0A4P6Q173_9ACTN|nr:hypothetical protein [Streptomonospora litoralis]QBI54376.1 hypothetical protein EKD16_12970 [Streptomonospora litoralis]
MDLSSPDGLTFFLDRGLGSRIVAGALRDAGWQLETMDERYGKDSSQRVEDVQWIEEATAKGDVLLCKDLQIAVNPLEAHCIYMNSARAFGLANRRLKGPPMVELFLGHAAAVCRMAHRAEGPYVVAISEHGLRRRKLHLP